MHLPYAALAGVLVALSTLSAAAQPSFNCAQAQTAAPTTICKDPKLGALDRSVDEAFTAALKRLGKDQNAQKALREEQRWFLDAREEAREAGDAEGLSSFMEARRDRLHQISVARSGFEGAWVSADADVRVTRRPDGTLLIEAEAAEWITARWTCAYQGIGRLQGSLVSVSPDEADSWPVTLRRKGSVLVVEERSPSGTSGAPPHCGAGGQLSGTYFPARAVRQ